MRLGLFEQTKEADSPLCSKLAHPPRAPDYKPHVIWVNVRTLNTCNSFQFIAERVDIAKYSCKEQTDILEMIFAQSLSMQVGSSPSVTSAISLTAPIGDSEGDFDILPNVLLQSL